MDVDEYINYQITEIYCDNVFWADENVRMWRERKPGGRWRWILQDYRLWLRDAQYSFKRIFQQHAPVCNFFQFQ